MKFKDDQMVEWLELTLVRWFSFDNFLAPGFLLMDPVVFVEQVISPSYYVQL